MEGTQMKAQKGAESLPYSVNDYVMYRRNGICRIDDIRVEKLGAEEKLYYVLKPLYDDTLRIYAPVDFAEIAQHMRRALTADEISGIIARAEKSENRWIEDGTERAAEFERLISGGDRADLLWVVKTLSLYRLELRKKDRRMTDSDKKLLTTAEKLITDEFAFALNIDKQDVTPYILSQVGKR